MRAAEDRPQFNLKLPILAPLLFLTRGYHHFFSIMDTSTRDIPSLTSPFSRYFAPCGNICSIIVIIHEVIYAVSLLRHQYVFAFWKDGTVCLNCSLLSQPKFYPTSEFVE